MLRLVVLVLVLLNAGYYAYSQGLLAAYGFGSFGNASQGEPQRMAQQINPEALRILNPPEAGQPQNRALAALAIANTGPTECLQVGVFNEEQTLVLRERLSSTLPQGSWVLEDALEPARWLVYMGKYSSNDAVARKKSELRNLGVVSEPLDNAALEPGLLLGSFATQANANQLLARIAKKGVKTAKVFQERAEQRGQRLKLAAVDAAMRSQLDGIKPQLAGKAFSSCL